MYLQHFINFIQTEKRQSAHTIKAYKTDLKQFENFIEENYEAFLQEVTSQMIKSWVSELKSKNIDNVSINRKISSIRVFYSYLKSNNFINENPAELIKTLKTKKRVAVFVPKSDLEKEKKDTIKKNNFQELRDELIFELLYQTGIRASEMIELKEQDIDFNEQTLKVTGKGNKQRIIPFGKELMMLIKSYQVLKTNTFSFNPYLIISNKGKKSYEMMLYKIIRQQLTAITTISKKSPHILRHTFATHMLNNGASLVAIKELLGHSSLAATQVYTHNSIEQLKTIHKSAHPKGGA